MGFFDEYVPYDGPGLYLGAAEKQVMIDNAAPFAVTSISEAVGKFGDEFNVTIETPDPATAGGNVAKVISFKIGYAGRDAKLRAMRLWLEEHYPENVVCKLAKVGRMLDLQDGRGAGDAEPWADWTAHEEMTA